MITRRPERVDRRPTRPESFLDRVDERAKCSLTPPFVLELYGDHGIGKSTLLSAMTHELADAASFADGVLYGDAVFYTSYDEYLSYVWDHLYSSNLPHKFVASPATLHRALRDLEVLLVIDDCEFSERELKSLHAIAGLCSLMLASERQRLTDVGRSLLVTGLPPDVAPELARAQLRRQFLDDDVVSGDVVAQVWADCNGNAKLFERSISRLAVGEPTGDETELVNTVMHLSGRSPVPVEVLEALAGDGPVGAAELAEALWRRRELNAHSPRYSVRRQLPPSAARLGVADNQRAIAYLADEVDFTERPDLRPFALGLLDAATAVGSGALPAAAMAIRSSPDGAERALAVAGRLADSFLSSGMLDGWRLTAIAMRRLARLQSAEAASLTLARAAHHLGANMLCRGEFGTAAGILRQATDHYYPYYRSYGTDPAARETLDAVVALREIAQRSSGGGDDSAGSAPPRPRPPDTGPAGAARTPDSASAGVDSSDRPTSPAGTSTH